jgi:alpha-1,2-mannosyltransferase
MTTAHFRNFFFLIVTLSLVMLPFEWTKIAANPADGTDFSIYYRAAVQFKAAPSSLYQSGAIGFDQFLYPPPCILLYLGFLFFSEHTAYLIYCILMYICLAAALLICQTFFKQAGYPITRTQRIGLLIFAFASAPMYHNASLGQTDCLVLLFSVLYLYLLRSRPAFAGLLLAAAIWIKIYPVLLLLPTVLYKEGRKSLIFCMLAAILIPVAVLPWIPIAVYPDFLHKLISVSRYTSAHIINQSFIAYCLRTQIPFHEAFQWPNIYSIPNWIKILNYVLMAALISLIMLRVWPKQNNPGKWKNKFSHGDEKTRLFLAGLSMLPLSAIISPLGWGHTFIFCLPLLMIALQMSLSPQGAPENNPAIRPSSPYSTLFQITRIGSVLLAALLLLIPVYHQQGLIDHWPALIRNIFYSRLLWIGLILIIFSGQGTHKNGGQQ